MNELENIVRFEGVTKSFGSTRVFDRLDLRIGRGENVAILGTSGAGKSVLLRMLIGLLRPDDGEIFLWGEPILHR